MPMTTRCDVLVAGCGPAGCAAATALARAGRSVVMLDRAQLPRPKLCGGLLTWKSMQLLEATFGLTAEQLIRRNVINHVSERYSIHAGHKVLSAGPLPFPFHFVNRRDFDHTLLQCAIHAGAKVLPGERVVECDAHSGVVRTAQGRTFQAGHIVGADGVNSVVRRSLELPRKQRDHWHRFMAAAIEISLPLHAFPRPVAHPELHVGFLDAGYGWVFPNRDRVVVGICGLNWKKCNFAGLFRKYLDFLKIEGVQDLALHGHPLPYGNFLYQPARAKVLLAGDAAGLVEPMLGEGIFFAMCSGWYAGRAIARAADSGAGAAYVRRFHHSLLPELEYAGRLRWLLFRTMKRMGPGSLGLFVNTSTTRLAEMVHGIRSYAWLRRKKWDF